MYAIDYEYDSQYLSDLGFVICNFDFNNNADSINIGSTITFNKVHRINGKKFALTSTKYDECITCNFDICKNPDLFDMEDRKISSEEFTEIIRWLNRRDFFKFQFINENKEPDDRICYYNSSFNINKIKINDVLYGIRLSMETDSPFGYGEEQNIVFDFDNNHKTQILYDISDEIGYIYPRLVITCKEDGDLTLYN